MEVSMRGSSINRWFSRKLIDYWRVSPSFAQKGYQLNMFQLLFLWNWDLETPSYVVSPSYKLNYMHHYHWVWIYHHKSWLKKWGTNQLSQLWGTADSYVKWYPGFQDVAVAGWSCRPCLKSDLQHFADANIDSFWIFKLTTPWNSVICNFTYIYMYIYILDVYACVHVCMYLCIQVSKSVSEWVSK